MSSFSEKAVGEGGSSVGGEDGLCCLGDDFAFVDFGSEFEKSNAGFLVAEGDGVLDGGGASVLRQERGVNVDDAVGEEVENAFGNDVAEGG